jgi:hypothetical protein
MAFSIITRAQWGGRPADSCTSQNPANLLGVTIHHTASPRAPDSGGKSATLVRGIQTFHMDISDQKYVDIAYNFLFDDFGQIFAGRGWTCRSGANGTTESNRTHLSFCYIGNSDSDPFNDTAQKACAWLLREAFKKGVGMHVVPHSHWGTGTACPGAKAKAWVTSGAWKADMPSTRRVQYLLMDDGVIKWKSSVSAASESRDRMKKFLNRLETEQDAELHKLLAEEGRSGKVSLVRKVLT